MADKQAGECLAALILSCINVAIKDMYFVMNVKTGIDVLFVNRIIFPGILMRLLQKNNSKKCII